MISARIVLSVCALTVIAAPLSVSAEFSSLMVSQTIGDVESIPKGAQRVPLLTVELSAGCPDNVVVTELAVTHDGFGDSSDIERVYAIGGTRLTRTRRFDGNKRTAVLRFSRPFVVEACETRSLTIYGDFSADATSGGEHRVSITSEHDIVADTDEMVLHEPVSSHSPKSTVRPASVGVVNVTVEGANKPLRFGKSRTLARIRLEADNEQHQEIHTITLTNHGKATDGDLKNLRIHNRKGEVLTDTKATMDGDGVTLTFSPALRIDRNDEVLLELIGDITASRKRTIRFVLEEPSDLEASPRAR